MSQRPEAGRHRFRKFRLKVLSLFSNTGFEMTSTLAAWEAVPVISTGETVEYPIPRGAPLTKLAIPETCQSWRSNLRAVRLTGVLGRSQTQFSLKVCVRSNEASP
jgi:hypothetical protein